MSMQGGLVQGSEPSSLIQVLQLKVTNRQKVDLLLAVFPMGVVTHNLQITFQLTQCPGPLPSGGDHGQIAQQPSSIALPPIPS
jgi:hypothetical protein